MLILTRRPMQTLTIGGDITITVMEIRGCQVRIGITAPGNITVLRGEVRDKSGDRTAPDASS